MEVDSPSEPNPLPPQHQILQRLAQCGVPEEQLIQLQPGLIDYVKVNKSKLPQIIYAILPNDDENTDHFYESMKWLQWLIFENEPQASLATLPKQRRICGAVWGERDIAYSCETCQNDPTCAICVSCFQNGNHKDHDYALIYTDGGCCDCGDVTAWKPDGFCSNHSGTEEVQPLPDEIASSAGPVLYLVFLYWKEKLMFSDELTDSIVDMLLEFCVVSESLLSFISVKMCSVRGLLDVLVRGERFLSGSVVNKLHELLLKLVVGEANFKYEFAKVFMKYYADIIQEANEECNDDIVEEERYPALSVFSVQIFTVPNLTLRLVKEMKLLDVLLGCVLDIFFNCLGEEGNCIEIGKWANLYGTTDRVMEDIGYVMSHDEVLKYIIHEEPKICRTWVQLLAFVQGMDPQKRVTDVHVEEETEYTHMPFRLGSLIASIHSLLVSGIFSGGLKHHIDGSDGLRPSKISKLTQEISVCNTTTRSVASARELQASVGNFEYGTLLSVLSSARWLTGECLRAIEKWFGLNAVSTYSQNFVCQDTSRNANNVLALKKMISRIGTDRSASKVFGSVSDENTTETGWGSESVGLLSLTDWPDINYDVSSQDISVHIPLHRLLAVLLQKLLSRSGGLKAYNVINFTSNFPSSECSDDLLGWILGECHPFGFSAFLMEHPLRIRVFCAQIRAGMWQKNGDAAITSCDWYYYQFSEQDLELDLFLLQCCAASAPPDLYVKRILDRFGLANYLSLSLERSDEYEPVLLLEMLTLIIQVVKERRFCGHSTSDTLRRELIFNLASGDATRGELVKSLTDDLSKNDQFQEILDTVAVYANPSKMKQGKYSLRKACWEELDLYHPRWNSRGLQIAEERYLQICKVSALTVQLPRWTDVFYPLNGISRIATCGTVVEIVRAVLFYAVCADKPSSSRAPDGVLVTALHLLSLALDICHVQRESSKQLCSTSGMAHSLPVLALACEEVDIGVTNKSDVCKPKSLLSLLVSLMMTHKIESVSNFSEAGQSDLYSMTRDLLKKFAELDVGCMIKLEVLSPEVVCRLLPPITDTHLHASISMSNGQDRKAKAKEQQAAILEKMRVAQSKFMASLNSTSNKEVDVSMSEPEVHVSVEEHPTEQPLVCSLCRDPNSKSSVSYMVLLQKSRLASFAEGGPPSWEQVHTLDKECKFKREVDFSNDSIPGEVDAFQDVIKAELPAAMDIQLPSISDDGNMYNISIETLEANIYKSIQKDMQDIQQHSNVSQNLPCNSTSPADNHLIGSQNVESILLGSYVASLSREASERSPVSGMAEDEDAFSTTCIPFASFDGFGPTNCDGIYISSCGHAMHQECCDQYLSSLRERHDRRIVFEGHAVELYQGEFLCPVCRRLANSVLPMVSGEHSQVQKQMMLSDLSSEAGTVSSTASGSHVLRLAKALSLLRSAASAVGTGGVLEVFSFLQNKRMEPSLGHVVRRLSRMYFPNVFDKFLESGRVSDSVILWDTLKYSLISTEIAARGGKSTSVGGSVSGIPALNRELESSSGFILSLLLQVVQYKRSENCLPVLLRFRGIQFFKDSICSGVSTDQFSIDTSNQLGFVTSELKPADMGVEYPDIQFWRRAADPVLTHDPFSSLMWILFVLPRPFLSSVESFLSLVHLFYSVCVVQALITCCGHNQLDLTNFGSGDCLIRDICKIKGESVATQQLGSQYIDSSCHPKDLIRILSHPYLRRCALLWKLLKSSISVPFCDKSHLWNVSSPSLSSDIFESDADHSVELKAVKELESMFQIPDLESILKDTDMHAISLKWVHHFYKESVVQQYGRMLHLTPAVPFRLMHLPLIYQDLLERYIKPQCPACKATLFAPALCLLCGRLCSLDWEYCCRESVSHLHAMSCGAGIGIFLQIRKTTILLQRCKRHAPWPSPYLDAFGEEDVDLLRGKPLYLNEERYAALTHMVASHGLDQSSEVLRQTTV